MGKWHKIIRLISTYRQIEDNTKVTVEALDRDWKNEQINMSLRLAYPYLELVLRADIQKGKRSHTL